MQEVIIDPECFFTLITASLEVYNKESTGVLVGNLRERKLNGQKKRVIVLKAAHPFQTAKRNPTWCDIGNFEAFGRARGSTLSLPYTMVGEFHSHPNRTVHLSEADTRYAKQRAKEILEFGGNMLNHHWLELVISVRKREYKRPQKTGWSWKQKKRRLEVLVKISSYVGYKISIGGFWIGLDSKNGHKKEAVLGFPKNFSMYQLT